MAKKKLSRMIYTGGHSGAKGLLGVLAFPEEYGPEVEHTVFYTTKDGQWGQIQFDFDIVSLTFLDKPKQNYKAWWLIGKRGEVVEAASAEPKIEKIATAGTGPKNKFGYLNRIRAISGDLFICGHRRQVYARRSGKWELISSDILDDTKKSPGGFESIDGFSSKDIYAAGRKGEIWSFDGRKWRQCPSPTNEHLADLRCIGDEVWVCGDHGTVIRGREDSWEVVWNDEEPSESWWGVEEFQGSIYLAGSLCIGVIDEGEIEKVQIRGKREITSETLHSKEGILWSIGAKNILMFDGKKWSEVVAPENR